MSDSNQPTDGGATERSFIKFTPEGGKATFREELDEVRTLGVDLLEVYVESPREGAAPDHIRLTFEVSLQAYRVCEMRRWFGLKPGLAEGMGFDFRPQRPVRIVAHVDDDTMKSSIFPDFASQSESDAIQELIAPLYDPDDYGIESPLGYQYESVTQAVEEGAKGFSPETVAAIERAAGPIPMPREMFVPAPQPEEGDEDEMEGVTFFETQQTWTTAKAETMTPARFAGPVPVEGTLKEVKLALGVSGVERLSLVVEVPHDVYSALDAAAIFDLTDESKGPNLLHEFDPDRPVELTLVLKPEWLERRVVAPGLEPADAVELIAEALESPESDDRLRETDCYVYQSVMQQPEGFGFAAGFNNTQIA